MRSATSDVLPKQLRAALKKFGADISVARRRRGITTVMMAERMGIARSTYDRLENGDPRVAIGTYMMALFVLGLGSPIADLVDPKTDDTGMMLGNERLPKRVRPKQTPQPK